MLFLDVKRLGCTKGKFVQLIVQFVQILYTTYILEQVSIFCRHILWKLEGRTKNAGHVEIG